MKIYLVRHGETYWNQRQKHQGLFDDILNSTGISQAENLADSLIGNNFELIFSSPLKRARQTANIISDKIKAPIIEKKELLERDFGNLTGKTYDEFRQIVLGGQNLEEIDLA